MGRGIIGAMLALALLLAGLFLKDGVSGPPPLRTASAPGMFDATRATDRLARILGDERPHPVDSEANDAVRDRLIAELRAAGLEPRVTDDFICNGSAKARGIACGRVRNVIATMGPAEGRHLLLATHYDSTPVGPGASDAGLGVATLLEVAAQLRGRPLSRPVSFLFDEGEESGLLGAHAFLERDPLARNVDTLLNFEARGVDGPAIMFETSSPNGPAITRYAVAVDRPAANSLSIAISQLIPNTTDVAVLKDAGWTILNFAVIGNETRYHTPGDDMAAFERRSLQHMGDQALAVVRAATNGAAEPAAEGEKVFTDLWGRALIVLPAPVAVGSLFLPLAVTAYAAWRRQAFGRPLLAVLFALAGAGVLTFLIQTAVGWAIAGEYWRGTPILIKLATYATAMLAAVAALAWARWDAARLRAAFWLVFLLVGAALSVALPGASIYFLLVAPPAAIGLLLASRWPAAERIGAILSALLLFALWAPTIGAAETTLDHATMAIFAPLVALVLLPALIELAPLFVRAPARPLLAALAAIAVVGWVATLAAPDYSANRKQPFGIEYAVDADAGTARWLVVNDGAALPAAMKGFEGGVKVPWSGRKRWASTAPVAEAPAPAATLTGTAATPEGRIVRLRIGANGADTILLRGPPQAKVIEARMNGSSRPMGGRDREESEAANRSGDNDFSIRCQGRSCDGATVELLLGNARPQRWSLVGIRSGLPASAASLIAARPANAQPQYNPDATIGVRRITL
ncbi:M20/M25/M40 family metallo-hydrolase [Allosphingosinicella indica]|uniref:Vacuolar membrane protease n=1 Tax=Allosphingosinicella indica TaxID=941907 RepID=A0A1X7GYV8_9SPHN|nr:M20/M25/M40 family metallo-hydrolase [Allosphingosinicella indica]SMF76072.1 Peptidase family M28 [Allosphingosinicella indica]